MSSICESCNTDKEYENIGTHWYYSPSHRPEITETQHEIITGLVMGDGCVEKRGDNSNLRVSMINKKYLDYLDNLFGPLSQGVSKSKTIEQAAEDSIVENADPENYNEVYEFRTTVHPELNRYNEWYESGKKVWNLEQITPTILKHFYVCDGSLNQKGSITIAMSNEIDRRDEFEHLIEEAGIPSPSNWNIYERKVYGGKHCKAQWTKEQTKLLFEYMGDAPTGFERKWL